MSLKSDSAVPAYLPNQSYSTDPAFLIERSEARQLKKSGRGFFHFSGRIFVFLPDLEANWEEIAKRYDFRDESACIQEPTMFAYVIGERRAIAAVNAWA